MTKQIKKLSCEECNSNDLDFQIFVDEFGEPIPALKTETISIHEAWCNNCEMWQGVKGES